MNGPGANPTQGITLVEQAVAVGGDVVLDAGDFLFVQSGNIQENNIYWYDTSADSSAVLVDGDDIGIDGGGSGEPIVGIELVETGATVGGVSLSTGDILVAIGASGTVGDNNLAVTQHDVFALNLTATTYGSGTAAGTATMLFDGDGNVDFDNPEESIDAISLIIDGVGSNQAPVISNSGGSVDFTENGAPVVIDGTITVADPDSTDFDGGALSVSFSAGGSLGDRLSIWNQGTGVGQIGVTGNSVTYNFGAGAVVIGSFTGGFDPGSTLVVNLNSSANATATQALMRNITFWNTSDNPATGARTIEFAMTDGDGGTSNTITQTATVTAQPDAPVAVNDSFGLEFDGIDDYVVIADDPSLVMTNSMTMEAWINPDASANANRMIINKEGEYEVALFSDDKIYWAFANTDPGWAWHDTGYTVTNGEWTHIAVTYDNGTVTTYVNGNVVDVYDGSGSIGDAYPVLNELRIGGRSNNPADKFFDGKIDDVRIWNTARTQGEIQSNLDAVLTGGEAGLAGHWSFSEGTGAATADSTAAGNGGTLVDGGAGTVGPQWTGYVTDEDTPLIISVASGIVANDIDIDGDTLTVTQINGSGANVGSTFTLPSGANLTVNAAGDFTYDPNGGFEYLDSGQRATDTFAYQIDDGNGGTETATVTVTVTGVNDAPTIAANTGTTVLEGSTGNVITSVMLSEGDFDDDGSELTYTITSLPSNGTLSLNGFGTLGLGNTFTQADLDAGKVTYDHDDSETTTDSFGFSLADGGEDGSTPASGTFNITITLVNDNTTTAINDTDGATEVVLENASVGTAIGVTAFASDADTGDTVTYSLDNDDGGRFTIDTNTGIVTVAGVIDREADGASRSITVRATSTDTSFQTRIFSITVNDVDEFDVGAVSDSDATANAVDENTVVGTVVGIDVAASDNDATNNTINYSLADDDGGRFTINSSTGVVTVNGAIDRETDGASRNITVRATSSDTSFTDQVFAIAINDVDEFDVGVGDRHRRQR